MASNRIGRINEEIQRELASLIPNVKDISVLDKSDCAQVLKGLKSASGYLRRELGHALQLRYTPELTFVRDDSIDQGAHILDMLRDPNVVKPANPANEHIHLDEE